MAKKYVSELKEGKSFISFFVVRTKELKEYDNKPYLILDLMDKTGRIDGVVWDNVDRVNQELQRGDVAKVQGVVTAFRDILEIKVKKIRKSKSSEYQLADFLPESKKNREDLFKTFSEKAESLKDPHLKKLLKAYISDSELCTKLKDAPAGKLWHRSYLGGLLEHTLAIVYICESICKLYGMIDRDLLVAGALIHDMGKTEAYECKTLIDYSDAGRLEGHLSLGYSIALGKLEKVPDFPEELKKRLLHLLLSHQGRFEYGSPVLPMTLEALALYYANDMDSKASGFVEVINEEREKGRIWSRWIPLIERFVYIGPDSEGREIR
jgi:3'-5' exoribonuclease